MSEASTQYDVALRYVFKDGGASKGVEGLSHQLDGLAKHGAGVGNMLSHIGVALAGAFGLHKGYEALVGFNAEMQDMKITMTALTQANLNEPFELARVQMDAMVDDFTAFAKQSPLTTKEIVEFAQNVEAGVFSANGSLQDFKVISEQGALAAKMLGADANYAGVEIQEMLMGAVRKNMRFARNLLGFAGEKDTNEFNAKSDLERLEIVKKALTSPAMKQAGKQFQESFTGVTSTLKDQLQLIFGQIGLPLFKALTEEVKKWTEWLDKNPDKIKQFAADFQSALAEGFAIMKEVAGFIVEHKDLLLMLAKAYLASKAVGMVAGIGGGLVQSLAGLVSGPGSFSMLGLSITGVIAALGAWAGVLELTAQAVDSAQEQDIASKQDWPVLLRGMQEYYEGRKGNFAPGSRESRTAAGEGQGAADLMLAKRVLVEAADAGLLTKADRFGNRYANAAAISFQGVHAGLSDEAIQDYIRTLNQALGEESRYLTQLTPEQRRAQFGEIYDGIVNAFHEGVHIWETSTFSNRWVEKTQLMLSNAMGLIFKPDTGDALKAGKNGDHKGAVNVNISRIEVQDPDPDRFVFQLAAIGRRAAKNPSGAYSPQREG